MYDFRTCVSSLPLLALALLQVPQALPPTRDQLFALLGGYLESLRVQAGIPGMAAAIMDNDGLAWEQAFGQPGPVALPCDQNRHTLSSRRSDPDFRRHARAALRRGRAPDPRHADQNVQPDRARTRRPRSARFLPTHPATRTTRRSLYRPGRLDVLASAVSACNGTDLPPRRHRHAGPAGDVRFGARTGCRHRPGARGWIALRASSAASPCRTPSTRKGGPRPRTTRPRRSRRRAA